MLPLIAATDISKRGGAPPPEFVGLGIFWVLLGLSFFLFSHFYRQGAHKKSWISLSYIIIFSGILGGFVYYTLRHQQALLHYIVVPAIILISVWNIRRTRFCGSCGKTLYRQPIFSRTQSCPHCGTQLK